MDKDIQQIRATKKNLEELLNQMFMTDDFDGMNIEIKLQNGTTSFSFGADFYNGLVSALNEELIGLGEDI